jgi:Domain of unknown function (DUF4190)/Tetratricopeptide repeat
LQEILERAVETARQFYADGKYQDALSTCESAEASGLDSADLASIHSVALISLKRYDEAETFLQLKLDKYPTEDRLYYNYILVLVEQKRTEGALSVIDCAEKAGLDTARIATARALIMLRQRRHKEAVTFLEEELAKFPDEAKLHFCLGMAYWGTRVKSRLSKARGEFQKARELDESALKPLQEEVRKKRIIWLVSFFVLVVYFLLAINALQHTHFVGLAFVLPVALIVVDILYARSKGRLPVVLAPSALFVVPLPSGRGRTYDGYCITSMVLGIISILLQPLGIPLGITAIVFSVLGRRKVCSDPGKTGRGMAIAGLVCGIVGIAVCTVMIVVVTIFIKHNMPHLYPGLSR